MTELLSLHFTSLPSEPRGKPKNTGVGSLSLLQGNFPVQESNCTAGRFTRPNAKFGIWTEFSEGLGSADSKAMIKVNTHWKNWKIC